MIDAAGYAMSHDSKAGARIVLPPPKAGNHFPSGFDPRVVVPPPPQTAPDPSYAATFAQLEAQIASGHSFPHPPFTQPGIGHGDPPAKARRIGEADPMAAFAGSALGGDANSEEMEEMMALQVEQQRIAAERQKIESERQRLKAEQQKALDQQQSVQDGAAGAQVALVHQHHQGITMPPPLDNGMTAQAAMFQQHAMTDAVVAQGNLLQQRALQEGVMNAGKMQQTLAFMTDARETLAHPKAPVDQQQASAAVEKAVVLVNQASSQPDASGAREKMNRSMQEIHAGLPLEVPISAPKPGPVEARLASWAKMQGAMARMGLQDRSTEYAIAFANLQDETLEATKRFNEAVQMMDQLMSSAHSDVMQQHLMTKLQMQAQQAQQEGQNFAQAQGAQMVHAQAQQAQAAHALAAAAALTPQQSGPLPRREGMSECQYYMKTGECKYGSTCKWDHPERKPPPELNRSGLPVRQGAPDCQHYMQHGGCKFGTSCQFNHPEKWGSADNVNAQWPPLDTWPSTGAGAPLVVTLPGGPQM